MKRTKENTTKEKEKKKNIKKHTPKNITNPSSKQHTHAHAHTHTHTHMSKKNNLNAAKPAMNTLLYPVFTERTFRCFQRM